MTIAPPFASAGASRAVSSPARGQLRRWLISPATAAFFSFPAAADEYRFGGSVLTFDGREVVFTNGPTGREHPADFHRDMTQGLTVRVVIVQELNPQPDTIMVIPPPGYIAVPETMTVEEYGRGVIVIVLEGLS
jgi:hypothetical protein